MKAVCLLNLFYLLFQGYKFTNIPDPCGKDLLDKDNVVTMCEDGTALEELASGSSTADSVVVRINKQQGSCKCSVRLLSDTSDSSSVYVRAYNQLTSAAPGSQSCGLYVQIETTSTNVPYSHIIKCNEATSTQTVQLPTYGTLEIMSKLANGSFDHGYCLQISRENSAYYTVIGACVGAFVSILAIILCILLLNRRQSCCQSRENVSDKNEDTNNHSDIDNTYGLKDNVLYVPSLDTEQSGETNDAYVGGICADNHYIAPYAIDVGTYSECYPNEKNNCKNNAGTNCSADNPKNCNLSVKNTVDEGNYATINTESQMSNETIPQRPKNNAENDRVVGLTTPVYAVVDKKRPLQFCRKDEYAVVNKSKQKQEI